MRRFTVAACLALAAGCAASPAALVRVSAPAASHDSGAATNRHAAEREARRLLTLTGVPPGAKPLRSKPLHLDGPAMGTPGVESLVDATQFWSVPMTIDQALSWFSDHPPQGHLTKEGTGSSNGRDFRTSGYGYWGGSNPAWQSAELEISVGTSKNPDRSNVRVDGVVVWLDPSPLRVRAPGLLHFTVGQGCPTTDRGAPEVSNEGHDLDRQLLPDATPLRALTCLYDGFNGSAFSLTGHRVLEARAASAAARRLLALPLSHVVGGEGSCPNDSGSRGYIAFDYPGGRSVDVSSALAGCTMVSNGDIMTAAGDLRTLFTPK